MAKEAIGIKNYRTYQKTLTDLIDFGFIKMIQISKNQYSSNIIAIVKNTKAPTKANTKALDKALIKHHTKQGKSIVSIDIQEYNNTNLQKDNNTNLQKDIPEINSGVILEPLILDSEKVTKPKKEKKPTDPLFKPLKEIYIEWYRKQFKLEPVFSAKEHIGINGIIAYFKINQYDYENTIESWQIILNKFTEWDKFYQNSTTPSQINCNLSNIIIKLKNGKSTNGTEQRAKKFSDEAIAESFRKFNS